MDLQQLIGWAEEPATHQKIVGDYEGCYSLGVTDNPPGFLLRVEPDEVSNFPTRVNIHGIEVPVVVHGNIVPSVPLGGSVADAFGTAPVLQSGEDILARVRADRDEWGEH